ncbi:hypothetical protein KUTeg_019740 [Tegillarca granosa]|uniref:Transglutaminase-like domain-containing protein n=1 Tax=Tegillarca granosa TaxID=220873 RepID=A0ABQ9EFF5_TEGGR|nr:hypothetical protein KUTeg_019740 [Tegillarca granosa]
MPWSFFTRRNRISRKNKRRGTPVLTTIRENCSIHNYGDDFSDSDEEEPTVSKPKPTKPKKPVAETELKVKNCDYNVEKNTIDHHTDEFDITEKQERNDGRKEQLVVRRGQPFNITLELTRPFDATKDDLRLIFEFDSNFYNPNPLHGTLIELILSAKDEPLRWGAKIKTNTGNKLTVKVFTPPTICVGKWKFMVDVIKKSDTRSKVDRYHCKELIYMLFNPWCKDDTVYLSSELHRNEYVLNETGKIFTGYWKSFDGRSWTFGQFQGKVLDCVMYMLDELKPMEAKYRGDPVLVSRKLSALVNSCDDDGVLEGNWTGNYSDGVSPSTWTGSVKILEDFYSTKETVRYGQCWVFSGVLTTVCRAIGIPARSVTNFCSAHDTDSDVIIESIVPETGNNFQIDSIWNFHVWNDVWMARPDLPDGYDGWQALDATPQEATEDGSLMCCGPCPLKAIRTGEVLIPYDGAFIFAELNADQVHWKYSAKEGKLKKFKISKDKIGKYISTCLPKGVPDRESDPCKPCQDKRWEDITSEYKHSEGSPLERLAVKCAVRSKMAMESNLIEELYKSDTEDVEFEFEDPRCTMIGSDFEVKLKINNKSKETRTAVGYICILTKTYTGKVHKVVKSEQFNDVKLSPNASKSLSIKLTESEYTECLTEQCLFEFREMFSIKETGQTSYDDQPFKLKKPTIEIKAPTKGKVGEPMKVEVSFVNPLKVALTGCVIGMQGAGLYQPISYRRSNVGPSATFFEMFVVTPKKKGERKLIVNFNANEIEMVEGDLDFIIAPQ